MTDTILVLGRIGGAPQEELLDAFEHVFNDSELVFYALGEPTEAFDQKVARDSIVDVVYDLDVENERPTDPDLEYLRTVERRLPNSPLWRSLVADRRLTKDGIAGVYHRSQSPYSHRELLAHAEARLRSLESLFAEYDFTFVYTQQIMYLAGHLAFLLADSRDIPRFRFATTRIKDRYVAQDGFAEHSAPVASLFREADVESSLPYAAADDYLSAVQSGEPLYTVPDTRQWEKFAFSLDNVQKFLSDPMKYVDTEYYYDQPALKQLLAVQKKRLRERWLFWRNTFDEFDTDARFAYFPLHVQPELALMVRAPFFMDLPTVVRNCAKCLPAGMKLYVKEHPNMVGVRDSSFYDELRRLPHVRVISPSVNSTDVLEHAEVTISINSSVGLQSLIHEVPVVTLSNPNYSLMESVQTAESYDGLYLRIVAALDNGVNWEELRRYIAVNLRIGASHDQPASAYFERLCRQIVWSIHPERGDIDEL